MLNFGPDIRLCVFFTEYSEFFTDIRNFRPGIRHFGPIFGLLDRLTASRFFLFFSATNKTKKISRYPDTNTDNKNMDDTNTNTNNTYTDMNMDILEKLYVSSVYRPSMGFLFWCKMSTQISIVFKIKEGQWA